jgi:hypothetical protein
MVERCCRMAGGYPVPEHHQAAAECAGRACRTVRRPEGLARRAAASVGLDQAAKEAAFLRRSDRFRGERHRSAPAWAVRAVSAQDHHVRVNRHPVGVPRASGRWGRSERVTARNGSPVPAMPTASGPTARRAVARAAPAGRRAADVAPSAETWAGRTRWKSRRKPAGAAGRRGAPAARGAAACRLEVPPALLERRAARADCAGGTRRCRREPCRASTAGR